MLPWINGRECNVIYDTAESNDAWLLFKLHPANYLSHGSMDEMLLLMDFDELLQKTVIDGCQQPRQHLDQKVRNSMVQFEFDLGRFEYLYKVKIGFDGFK